jgi:alanine racemase
VRVPALARPTWAELSRQNLGANLGLLRGMVGKASQVLAVVKADAYGHGAVEAAKHLQRQKVQAFGVATLEEAVQLRQAGIKGQILLLGALEPRYVREAARARVGLTAWSRPYLDDAQRQLKGAKLDIHLKVDTGMTRLGFSPADVAGLLADFDDQRWSGLKLASAYTHLACADEHRDPASAGQLKAFLGLPWPQGLRLHAANSAALSRYAGARLAWVRSGLLLYGASDPWLHPSLKRQKPVLSLYSSVVRVQHAAKGQGVSYGHTFKALRPTDVATLCIGYADGVPRYLSNRGFVRVRGKFCRILGRVTMDLMMVDVTGMAGLKPGEPVALLDSVDGPTSPRGWAALGSTIAYEVLCGLSDRVPRRWANA